jgi:raffinose/stachyose/melibiose transport system substrate-binding protein
MKKLFNIIAVFTVMSMLLAGCAAPAPAATAAPAAAPQAAVEDTKAPEPTKVPATEAPKEKVTLTFMASVDWIKPAEQDLAKKFEDETGIHVDYQIIPSDQYFNVLKTKLNSGEAADIFGGQSGKSDLILQYDVQNNAVDLTGEEWTQRIDPNALDQLSLDGKVYGIEIWDIVGSNYWVVNYNKDIFKELGIEIPKNYDEFKAACEKIKAANITPIYEPFKDGWHHVLGIASAGPMYEQTEPGLAAKLNANQITLADDQVMLKAVTQLQELYKNGYYGKTALANTYADTAKAMASGKYAMTIDTLTAPAAYVAAYKDLKTESFGFFPVPLADNNLQPAHPAGPAKFIYAKSKHVAEAKQYLAFLAKQENLQYLLDNEPKFSSLCFSGLKEKWSPEQQDFLKNYAVKTIVYQDAVNYFNPQWMDIGKDLVSMYTGKMTPVDLLKSMDKRRAEMAKNAKDPAWK